MVLLIVLAAQAQEATPEAGKAAKAVSSGD